MSQYDNPIPDELWDEVDPPKRPQPARRRFQPIPKTDEFLKDCERLGLDVSSVINSALLSYMPALRSNGNSWEGVRRINY